MYCLSFLSRGRWLPLLSALCALFFLGPNSGVVEEANAQFYYGWPSGGRYWGRGRYGYGWGGYSPYVSYYNPYGYGYGGLGYGYGWGNRYWSPYTSTYPYYGTFRYLRHLENKQKRNNDGNRDLGKAKRVAANGAVPLPDIFFEGDPENPEGPQPFSDEFLDSEDDAVLVSLPVVGKANKQDSETEADSGSETETTTAPPLSSDEEEEGVTATSSASPELEDATTASTQEPSFLETTTSTTVAPASSSED
ncbi:hypothetical protein EMWEY_00001470 [Eimeria maxima]|uniref:Uncharacterized protein n=1 Tax=Eimeria maxima TaxID=5804 RepID=U6MEG6_EIMMA|nr:hypothetical protein EMWEY_00001470 [Eimeria maxima]CDJ61458.1 hypothetical protein EMWEY_00001470 [Eimeria maxima]